MAIVFCVDFVDYKSQISFAGIYGWDFFCCSYSFVVVVCFLLCLYILYIVVYNLKANKWCTPTLGSINTSVREPTPLLACLFSVTATTADQLENNYWKLFSLKVIEFCVWTCIFSSFFTGQWWVFHTMKTTKAESWLLEIILWQRKYERNNFSQSPGVSQDWALILTLFAWKPDFNFHFHNF